MKLKLKKPKSQLDEMQEQQLYKTNNDLMILTLIALLLAAIIQFLSGGTLQHVIGEVSVVIVISIIGIIKKLKNGIWSLYLCNGIKDYLLRSFIGGTLCGIWVVVIDIVYEPAISYFADFCVCFTAFFIFVLMGCLIISHIRNKRVEKLENEDYNAD